MFRSSSSSSHTNNMESAIENALKGILTAKQELAYFQGDKLAAEIDELRQEKKELETSIAKLKTELNNLGDQLTETQNEVLMQAYTTSPSQEEFETEDLNDDDGDDHLLLIDSQATVFGSPATRPSEHSNVNSAFEDEAMSVVTASTASTTSTVSSSKKSRAKKVYKSPKKWRRMIRTHRLQSIFFDDTTRRRSHQ